MSRRTGQNGSVSVRNGAYRGRWLEDVPGSVERVKRSVVLGFVREMTRSEARRKLRGIIEASGINSPRYLIPSADSFAKRVEWWEQNFLVRQKPADSHSLSPLPAASVRKVAPRFEVMMMTVFLKSTVRPFESVRRPSSRICSITLNTSGCAFSISSNRITL